MVIEATSAYIQYLGKAGKWFLCILIMPEKNLYLALIFGIVALLTGTLLNSVDHSSVMRLMGMKILIFFTRRPAFYPSSKTSWACKKRWHRKRK